MSNGDEHHAARRPRHSFAGGTERETGRLEAFSDAIFAIAITLLILDVKLPPSEGNANLLGSLLALWPSYFALVFSFVIIGIYWSNHHYIFKLFRNTDHIFNLLHLLFLLTISILPFPTRVLADYIESEQNRMTGVAFYTLALLLPAAAWFAIWAYARWGSEIVDPKLQEKFLRRLTFQYGASVVLYLLAFVLTIAVNVWAGLALAIGLTLLYLLPPPRPLYDRSI
ncbi:MAG TPA: TMEM175 family protein [Xanthobacteraceae bacterium]|nr:TMEM175 family protein [Xanthobacteraceae bacterium]